jgi:hypothetical protein
MRLATACARSCIDQAVERIAGLEHEQLPGIDVRGRLDHLETVLA